MKRILRLLLTAVLLLASVPAFAAGLTVFQGVITTQVADRAPVDAVEVFPASVGKLYCFTRIEGASETTTVTHIWFRGSEEMGRIDLPVRSGDWRTWSSKRILPSWRGDWRVEVHDGAGNLLQTIPFTLQ